MNIHINSSTDSWAREFVNLLDNLGLTQYVTEATHQLGNTLDLVMSQGINIENVLVSDITVSDHYCVFFDALLSTPSNKREFTIQKRYLDTTVETKFSFSL